MRVERSAANEAFRDVEGRDAAAVEPLDDAAHLAHHLIDHDFSTPREPNNSPGLLRRSYQGDGLVYDVARVSRPCPYGAFVRVAPAKGQAPAFASSARNLGLAHFDRGFETTRVALVPTKTGTSLTVTKGGMFFLWNVHPR